MQVDIKGYRIHKDPTANLDYGFDWLSKNWLDSAETITSSAWVADAGITLSSAQISGGITSVFAAGGEVGKVYKLTNTITTSAGRTDSRTINLEVKTR